MLKLIDRIIPRYAHKYLLICGLTQFLSYFCTKQIHLREAFSLSLPVDEMIPLHVEWVTVYVGSYLFWTAGYIALSHIDKQRFLQLFRADCVAKVICAAAFILLPTEIVRPELPEGFFGEMLGIIYALDTPDNLFPSVHCLTSWLLARSFMKVKAVHPALRWGAVACALLVFASTLFTRQHFIIDIPAGVIAAEAALLIARRSMRRKVTDK